MTKMNERTMSALFGMVTDPIYNRYDIKDNKRLAEMQRLIKVLNIANEQKVSTGAMSARGLAAFKMLVSNN